MSALILLCTKRYFKEHYTVTHYAHALVGYYSLFLTLFFSLKAFANKNWELTIELHSIIGTVFMLLAVCVSLSGSAVAIVMRVGKEDAWKPKESVTRMSCIHRWLGYSGIILG